MYKFVANDRPAKFSTSTEDLDRFLNKVKSNSLHEFLVKPMRDYFRTTIDQLDRGSLTELVNRVKYNLITQTLDEKNDDPYNQLKIKDSTSLAMLSGLCETALSTPKLSE